jgi:glycosyltransferase involved in cell wall biosynthesis
MPRDLHRAGSGDGGYLAFLGRICPEKAPAEAIAIAERARVPLRIAAKVDKIDRAYFEDEIEPLLSSPFVEFIGEIGDSEKTDFLGRAAALLLPICWPEPFGLVMIEAMACGTPVIAYPCGAVPEIVEHGVTGFIVNNAAQAAEAVHRAPLLDRARIRAVFEARFTAERMTRDYLAVYEALVRQMSRRSAA